MVTVFRAYGLHIVIFVDDHRPAHVHVFGDGQAKIDLLGPGGPPVLLWSENMTKAEVCRAMRTVPIVPSARQRSSIMAPMARRASSRYSAATGPRHD